MKINNKSIMINNNFDSEEIIKDRNLDLANDLSITEEEEKDLYKLRDLDVYKALLLNPSVSDKTKINIIKHHMKKISVDDLLCDPLSENVFDELLDYIVSKNNTEWMSSCLKSEF